MPFTLEAIAAIAAASQGIPRVINSICDGALTTAFGRDVKRVDRPIVLSVLKDLALDLPADSKPAAPAQGRETATSSAESDETAPVAPVRTEPASFAVPVGAVRIFSTEAPPQRHSFLWRWSHKTFLAG